MSANNGPTRQGNQTRQTDRSDRMEPSSFAGALSREGELLKAMVLLPGDPEFTIDEQHVMSDLRLSA
jgi:hypothetical protein